MALAYSRHGDIATVGDASLQQCWCVEGVLSFCCCMFFISPLHSCCPKYAGKDVHDVVLGKFIKTDVDRFPVLGILCIKMCIVFGKLLK